MHGLGHQCCVLVNYEKFIRILTQSCRVIEMSHLISGNGLQKLQTRQKTERGLVVHFLQVFFGTLRDVKHNFKWFDSQTEHKQAGKCGNQQ